jgi:hypothetical protein
VNEHHQNALTTNARQLRLNNKWNSTGKKERLLDFMMACQSVLFQVNIVSSKSDDRSSKAKEQAENRILFVLRKKKVKLLEKNQRVIKTV